MVQKRDQDRDDRTPGTGAAAVTQTPDVFGRADVFAKPQAPAPAPLQRPAAAQAFDPAAIMASVGETAYEWSIDSDVLAWGSNATEVLTVASLAMKEDTPLRSLERTCATR